MNSIMSPVTLKTTKKKKLKNKKITKEQNHLEY